MVLRDDTRVGDSRYLEAYLTPSGDLVLEGDDHGEGVTEIFGSDINQYEWTSTIASADLDEVRRVLELRGNDIVAELGRVYAGPRAHEIEARIGEAGIHIDRHVWIG